MKKRLVMITACALIAVICVGVFAACTPSAKSLMKKFEKEEYKAVALEDEDVEENIQKYYPDYKSESEIKYAFTASKGISKNIIVVAFNDKETAEEFFSTIDKFLSVLQLADIEIQGTAVAIGDKDSVELFKKLF